MNIPSRTIRFMAVLLIAALSFTIYGSAAADDSVRPAAVDTPVPAPVTAPNVTEHASHQPAADKMSELDFRNAMRQLWEEHVMWTRLYIVSVAANLPDQKLTAQRLLQNQVDIGNAIKPFYGDKAGDRLTALLKDHILIAADLLAAAKAGDTARFNTVRARWYANADEIAAFLNSANPDNWPLPAVRAEMKMHLDLTLKEASDRLQGNYAADIKDYDAIEHHILGMADVLSDGIVKQSSSRFK